MEFQIAYLTGWVQGGVLVNAVCVLALTAYIIGSKMGGKW